MAITYTLRRRDSRSFTGAGSGVTLTVATGTRGPNIVDDATALGSLTDAVADAPFLLAGNAAGTFARKVTLGSVARSFLGAATQADARTTLGLGTVSTLSYPGGTTLYLRADGTWASVASGGTWGSITGTLSSQADLQSALDARQPLDADLTSWAAVTRASGYDTFAATPSSANLAALLTDETGFGAGAVSVFSVNPTLTGVTVQQSGGSATVAVGHDGTRATLTTSTGPVRVRPGSSSMAFEVCDSGGTVRMSFSQTAYSLIVGVVTLSGAADTLTFGPSGVIQGTAHSAVTLINPKLRWPNSSPTTGIDVSSARVVGLTDGSTAGATLSSVPLTWTVSGTVNNGTPGVAMVYEFNGSSTPVVTGLSCSQVNGQYAEFHNPNATAVVMSNEGAGSTAANRFRCTGGADITLAQYEVAIGRYLSSISRWIIRKV